MLSKNPSINTLKQLNTQLMYLRKELSVSSKQHLVIEKIKSLTDLVIWGERHNPTFFEFFKDSKCIEHYFYIMHRSSTKESIICSIDCFSKLLINICSPKSVAYILSSETVTNMLSVKFKSMVVQVAEYYVNFLKTLSQKLSDNNVSFFLNARCPNMPLAWQSIRFIHHPESMIRNTSRNIILGLMKLKDQAAVNYLISFPFVVFYSHFASLMRSHWENINSVIENSMDINKFTQVMDDYDDLYLYFEDMLRISVDPIKKCILNGFMCEGVGTLLLNLLKRRKTIGIRTILYLLCLTLSSTESLFLSDFFCNILFGRFINDRIIYACTSVDPICSFKKEWSFRNFWDNYEEKIDQYCHNVFNNKEVPKQSIKPQKIRQYHRHTEGNGLFGQSNPKYESELQKLSIVYGFPYNGTQTPTAVDLAHVVKMQVVANQLTEGGGYKDNAIRRVIFECFVSSDDSLVILSMKLIMSVILNRTISKDILLFSGLAMEDVKEKENLLTKQVMINGCIQVLKSSIQSQMFRIQTVKVAVGMLSKIFEFKMNVMPIELHKLLMATYVHSIQKASLHLYNGKVNWQKTVEIFENAEAQSNRVETFRITPSDLFFQEKETSHKNVNNNEQKCLYQFLVFVLIRNLRYQLFPSRMKLSQVGLTGRNSHRERLETGKQVMSKQIPDEERIHCKYKDLNSNKYSSCSLICSQANFTLVEPFKSQSHHTGHKSAEWVRVVVDSTHKQVINMIDRSDPRKLILIINEPFKRNLSLLFEDAKSCYLTKAKLDSLKTESMSHYLASLVKHVQACLQDVTPT